MQQEGVHCQMKGEKMVGKDLKNVAKPGGVFQSNTKCSLINKNRVRVGGG